MRPLLHDVGVLWKREVRSALRERSVVINSILLPVLLYPLLLWVEMSALAFVGGLQERAPARVAIVGESPAHADVVQALTGPLAEGTARFEIRGADPEEPETLPDALRRLEAGDLDAIVRFVSAARDDPANPAAGAGEEHETDVVVHYDRSADRSRRALTRIESVIGDARDARLAREAEILGLSPSVLEPVQVTRRNVSPDEALGASILGLMIPLFLVISVALGCLVPAVDATAGERERGTWETLMTTQATRGTVVTAKYLYVASFGAAAGILNVTAMSLAIGPIMAPIQGLGASGTELAISLAPTALWVMAAGAVLLALFFAAAMMPLAAFARTFKDGQALVTPVFYVALLPLLLGQQSDRTLSPSLALVPVANIAMAVRDAIHGVFLWPLLGVSAAVNAGLILLFIAFARWILGFEDFLVGSHRGSPWRFVRERVMSR